MNFKPLLINIMAMGLVFGSARTPRVFADSFRFPAPYIYNAELKRLLLFLNFTGIHLKKFTGPVVKVVMQCVTYFIYL